MSLSTTSTVDELSELHLYDKNIVSLGQIRNLSLCSKLQDLSLHCNAITSVSHLDSLSSLTSLNLSSNKISKIEGLSHLVRLTTLNLSCNEVMAIITATLRADSIAQIRCVEGLDELRSLKILVLSYNKITSLEGLNPSKFLGEVMFSNFGLILICFARR